MKYTEYYKIENDLVRSPKVTKEAYDIVKAMYEPHWGRENNKKCLTQEELPIVYAFNLAEGIKNEILAAGDNYSEAVARESKELYHWGTKKQKHEVDWLYQRNTVLGITYYFLACEPDIDERILDELHQAAVNVPAPLIPSIHIPIISAMPYFDIFVDAARIKNNQDSEHKALVKRKRNVPKRELPDEKEMLLAQDWEQARRIFDSIFRCGLDMDKIGNGLNSLFNNRNYIHQQRYWYIIYQWFMELGFITSKRSGKDFRIWAIYMFGEIGYSTQDDFSKAKAIAPGSPSEWKIISGHEDFILIRDILNGVFNKEQRNKYLMDGRYIDWNL